MSYTIRYDQSTRAEREAAAIQDAREWLSTVPRFRKVMKALHEMWRAPGSAKHRVRGMYLVLEFAGIRGLPAKALIRRTLQLEKEEGERNIGTL
jgi:hypothetical protein